MFDYRESMDNHVKDALAALKAKNTNDGLCELVMALQEMSCRLDAIEERSAFHTKRSEQLADFTTDEIKIAEEASQ